MRRGGALFLRYFRIMPEMYLVSPLRKRYRKMFRMALLTKPMTNHQSFPGTIEFGGHTAFP